MEYNYELLRKCHGLRFRATFYGKPQEGIIKVTSENVMLCFGDEDPGYSATFGRMCARSFSKETFDRLPRDFEIVPRDPETYKDWQVGDVIRFYGNNEIIFRSGEVVVFKYSNDKASSIYTCSELFRRGYRLVRTDIEEQIIEEQKKYEPQDGDIVAWKHQENDRNHAISIYKEERRAYATIYAHGGTEYSTDVTFAMDIIRPATDEEKQQLFDAMAKEGKRWNAKKKVVEDIEPEDDEPADVQKMISDALRGYTPEGDIEGFPIEVVAKMLERQYEQCKVVNVSVFEDNKSTAALASGFDWDLTAEGEHFWDRVIEARDFSEFFKKYPKAEAPGAGMPFSVKKFDPVLVRDTDDDRWYPNVFLKKEGDKFWVLGVLGGFLCYNQCIPLNEDTEKLIDTAGKYEG